jgi:uncharacterized membrane protein YeaQ/YmgE (transglycosylase-associated protein family)
MRPIFLIWLIIGLLAGFLASRVIRRGGYGLGGDIVVGLIGAVLGGFLAGLLGLVNAEVVLRPNKFDILACAESSRRQRPPLARINVLSHAFPHAPLAYLD